MDHFLFMSPPGVPDNPDSLGKTQEMLANGCPPVISHLTLTGSPSYSNVCWLLGKPTMSGPALGGSVQEQQKSGKYQQCYKMTNKYPLRNVTSPIQQMPIRFSILQKICLLQKPR